MTFSLPITIVPPPQCNNIKPYSASFETGLDSLKVTRFQKQQAGSGTNLYINNLNHEFIGHLAKPLALIVDLVAFMHQFKLFWYSFQEHVLSFCEVTCLEHVSPLLFAGTTSGAVIMWNLETEKIVLRLASFSAEFDNYCNLKVSAPVGCCNGYVYLKPLIRSIASVVLCVKYPLKQQNEK